jgi:hypothetical protein
LRGRPRGRCLPRRSAPASLSLRLWVKPCSTKSGPRTPCGSCPMA